MGDNDPTTGTPPAPGATPPAPPAAPAGATFTQADLDRINAETRRTEAEAATRRMLAELGVDTLDAAKERLAALKQIEDDAKTELEREREARAAAEKERDDARALSHTTLVTSEVKAAFLAAGVNPDRLEGAMRLADLAGVTVKDGAAEGVAAVVDKVKSASPEWFGQPGRPFAAADASRGGGGAGEVDYRTASREDFDRELRRLGVMPRTYSHR